jgi:hypothetical protein
MAQMQAQQQAGPPEPEPEPEPPPAEPQRRGDGADGAPRGSPVERPAT